MDGDAETHQTQAARRFGALASVINTTLADELTTLTARHRTIAMPRCFMYHHAKIRELIEMAGGVSISDEALFVFGQGVDCAAVLARIQRGENQ